MIEGVLEILAKKEKAEIEKIKKEKREKLSKLEKDFQEKIAKKLEKERKEFREKIKKEIEEFRFEKERELNFFMLTKKKELLEGVVKQTIEDIKNLPKREYSQIIKNFLKKLPKNLKGKILADKKTKELFKEWGIKVTQEIEDLGFIFKTENLLIDCRIFEILNQKKEEIQPRLIKILFE